MKETKRIRIFKYDYESCFLTFYPQWCRMSLTYSPWAYFNKRPQIHTNLTTILGIIGIFILGLSWKLFLLLPLFIWCWGQIFIMLPFKTGKNECEYPQWGIYNYGHINSFDLISFVVCYGRKNKHLDFPWTLKWVRTSILLKDKVTWEHETKGNKKDFYDDKWQDKIHKEEFDYTYICNDGKTKQTDIAIVTVQEREWRRKWLMFTSLFNLVNRVIEITFINGIGEGKKKWGGNGRTTGCSYDMLKGESPAQTLRRMEKTRRFN